jgi:hypothetical protein
MTLKWSACWVPPFLLQVFGSLDVETSLLSFLDGSAISSADCLASLHRSMLLLVLANHIQFPDLTPKICIYNQFSKFKSFVIHWKLIFLIFNHFDVIHIWGFTSSLWKTFQKSFAIVIFKHDVVSP